MLCWLVSDTDHMLPRVCVCVSCRLCVSWCGAILVMMSHPLSCR
jgi:hypothetical protein